MDSFNTFLVCFWIALVSFFVSYPAYAAGQPLFKVLKVVDGDTIVVDVRGNRETVRLLGIDTPESVDPRKPVQCFGKAATEKLKSFVSNKSVILVDETQAQGNRDRYKRLLRYVYLPDSTRTFVNGEMVKQGFAFSYREYPVSMTQKFNNLEKYARENNLGLWGSCDLPVSPVISKTQKFNIPAQSNQIKQITPISTSVIQSINIDGDKDCPDFATQAQSQAYFTARGGSSANNVDRLDRDHDGIACEDRP